MPPGTVRITLLNLTGHPYGWAGWTAGRLIALCAYQLSMFRLQGDPIRHAWDSVVFIYNLSPIEDIQTDWLRRHLRHVLNEVNHGARYAVLRRGRPVAGLVPITEARALFEVTRADRKYRDYHEDLKRRDEDRLRRAVADMAQAEQDRDMWRR